MVLCRAEGMLKIRGDVKKSDTVATLLATKALQEMVTDLGPASFY